MTAISPLNGVGQILRGRGHRPQPLLMSENYSVWTTSQLKTVITFIPINGAYTLKTFDRWQHDEFSFFEPLFGGLRGNVGLRTSSIARWKTRGQLCDS